MGTAGVGREKGKDVSIKSIGQSVSEESATLGVCVQRKSRKSGWWWRVRAGVRGDGADGMANGLFTAVLRRPVASGDGGLQVRYYANRDRPRAGVGRGERDGGKCRRRGEKTELTLQEMKNLDVRWGRTRRWGGGRAVGEGAEKKRKALGLECCRAIGGRAVELSECATMIGWPPTTLFFQPLHLSQHQFIRTLHGYGEVVADGKGLVCFSCLGSLH